MNTLVVLENIVTMFDEIMATFPRLDTYISLFPADNGQLLDAIGTGKYFTRRFRREFLSNASEVFLDIVIFLVEAIKYFQRNPYSMNEIALCGRTC